MGLQYREGICICHGEERLIVKRISTDKYCQEGNQARLAKDKPKKPLFWASKKKQKPLKRTPIRYKPKTTGEGVFLEALWDSRPHVSFVSGLDLGDDYNVMCMSHVLSKGAYPGFRLYDKNLILKTPQEHHDWHNIPRDKLLEKNPNWQKVFDLEEELKREYYS